MELKKYYKEQSKTCNKSKHNKEYESYCFVCNEHLCEKCLISREHLEHDKISLKETTPSPHEKNILENIYKYLLKNKNNEQNLIHLYELLDDSFDFCKYNYYYSINIINSIFYYINNNPDFKADFSKEEYEYFKKILERKK